MNIYVYRYYTGPSGQEKWNFIGGGLTNWDGNFRFQHTIHDPELQEQDGVQLRVKFLKAGYEEINVEVYLPFEVSYIHEQPISETDYVPAPDTDINKVWKNQPTAQRIAVSFVVALAIMETFKAVRGFSMERFSPV